MDSQAILLILSRVIISPDIKKESVRIDMYGNEIDPITKRLIKPVEKPYIPTPEQLARSVNPSIKPAEVGLKDNLGDRIQKLIEEKVNKLVEEKINEALKKLL